MRSILNLLSLAILAASGTTFASPHSRNIRDHQHVAPNIEIRVEGTNETIPLNQLHSRNAAYGTPDRFSFYYPEESGNEVACGGHYDSSSWVSDTYGVMVSS